MSEPRLSAVIPSYQHVETVCQTVESVLAQEVDPSFEVVIVDDGSTDGSGEALQRFQDDPRVRLDVREHQGISATFQRGLELASAPWVAFCCSDDSWDPGHLQACWNAVQAQPEAVLCFGRARVVDATGLEQVDSRLFGSLSQPDPTEALLRHGNSLCFSAALFRRDQALEVGGFDRAIGILQDYDLYLRLLQRGSAVYLDQPTVRFRWDGVTNASGPHASVQRHRDLVRVLGRCLQELPRLEAASPLQEAVRRGLRRSHVQLARRLRGHERREHLAAARVEGLSGLRYAWERLRSLR